jgi:hypothetical protein
LTVATLPRRPELLAPPPDPPRAGPAGPVLLGVVLLGGTALRLVALDARGFGSDEAVYAGQAAALAGDPALTPLFPVVRAHPLLVQGLLSLLYRGGTSELTGRLLVVAFGVGTVGAVYLTGSLLHGRRVGLLAAAVLAVMPYHVVVTRQVLLDGPLAFFTTVALSLVARFAVTRRPGWLHAAGAVLGLACLSKETGVLLAGSLCAFVALGRVRVRPRDLLLSAAVLLAVAATYPLALLLTGRTAATGVLARQLHRRPDHGWGFYAAQVAPSFGWVVLGLAAVGLVARRRSWGWQDALLVSWAVVPVVVLELWSVKGYAYLLPATAPVAVLAARALLELPFPAGPRRPLTAVAAALALVSLAVPAWQRTHPGEGGSYLAGTGGVPGGRETGRWVRDHLPADAQLLALSPAMANVVAFYGHRRSYGLSVSTDPAEHNPAYTPVRDPEQRLERGDLTYLVWDSWSAGRSPRVAAQLLQYVGSYHGRAVHTQTATVPAAGGGTAVLPVIVVYEVRP